MDKKLSAYFSIINCSLPENVFENSNSCLKISISIAPPPATIFSLNKTELISPIASSTAL